MKSFIAFVGILIAVVLFPSFLLLSPVSNLVIAPTAHPGGEWIVSGTPGTADLLGQASLEDLLRLETQDPSSMVEPVQVPLIPMPADLPAPTGRESLGAPFTPATPVALSAPSPLNPTPAASFLALDDNNTTIPPDTMGAAGPNHLMVTLNTEVRYQNRSGGVISTVPLNTFWNSVGPFSTTIGVFDPRALYEPYTGRWIHGACADPRHANSSIVIAVSNTNSPTGSWNYYKIDVDATNTLWADYPSIGYNKNWIVVQVNMIDMSNNFQGTQFYVFDKAKLYSGVTPAAYTLFTQAQNMGGTIVPAVTYDNTISTEYLLQNFNGDFSGLGYLALWTITGSIGSETLTRVGFVTSSSTWKDFPSVGWNDFAPQLGDPRKIMTNDARLQNLVYRNGHLWSTQTIFLPTTGGTPASRSSIQWWQITPSRTVLQQGRIDDATGVKFYAFPSIAVNQFNDLLIGYSRFESTQYASAYYSYRDHTDALNSMRADTLLKAGLAKYNKTFGSTLNRWGDFSHTIVDPVNDTDFWTIQEYADLPAPNPLPTPGTHDRWATWWGKIQPLPTATHTSTATNTATFTATFTPTATNTATHTPTATNTATHTATHTNTPTATNTATLTPTATHTATLTSTPTATNTPTPTATSTQAPAKPKLYLPLVVK